VRQGAVEENLSDSDDAKYDDEDYHAPWGPILIVLAVELCERLTYYTLAGSQKTYLNKQLGFSPSSAAAMNSVFSMLCYMWCLPGGLLADSFGRYKVIVCLASIYALGTVVVAISVHADLQIPLKGLFLFGALGLIPLGTGGIKPNICNFGADQIGDETPARKETQKKFFSFFYLSINVGVLFAFGYFANLTTHGQPPYIPLEEGYFAAYIVAAASMIIAVMTFVGGTGLFTISPGGGIDGFLTMVKTVGHSVTSGGGWRAYVCALGWSLMPLFFLVTFVAALQSDPAEAAVVSGNSTITNVTLPAAVAVHSEVPNRFEEACLTNRELSDEFRPWDTGLGSAVSFDEFVATATDSMNGASFEGVTGLATQPRRLHGGGGGGGKVGQLLTQIAFVLGSISCICLVIAHRNNKWMKPLPKKEATTFTIEEVREGFATVPLIIVINICFNMGYNAMNNAMPGQACQMNTLLFGSQLNGAFFNLGDALAIIVFTPIFESIMYPFFGMLKGSEVRLGQKLIAGMLITALANCISAVLEIKRRHSPLMCWEAVSECAPNGIHMRNISAFWMFVPFALIGAGEILVNPCMYYFAYTAAPARVRSLVQAFNLFMQGAVSNAFTAIVMKVAFPNDLDTGNLEYYYFINVVCLLVGIILYFYLTKCGSNAEDIKEEVRDEELDPTEHEYGPHRHEEMQEMSGSSTSDSE